MKKLFIFLTMLVLGIVSSWADVTTPSFAPVAPVNVTSGWYQIKWIGIGSDTNTDYTEGDVSGKFVTNYQEDVTVNASNYSLFLSSAPTTATEHAKTFVYYEQVGSSSGRGTYGHIRSANGHYVTQTGAASAAVPANSNYIIYFSAGSYPNNSVISSGWSGNRYSLIPCGKNATPYIGQTAQNYFPMVQFSKVTPTDLGLQPWAVSFVSADGLDVSNTQVSYNGSGIYGLTKVYNNGTFFIDSSTTPTSSDFSAPNVSDYPATITVDASSHTISVRYGVLVTYNLYESDGSTLVNSVTIRQEINGSVSIPSSLNAATYYDYTTEGTIGSSDCTIKVTRTLKSGYVISLDGLSNSKCYNIRNNRGTWAVGSGATVVNSTVELNLAFLASDTKQQFAFITYEGNVYLYSVGEHKFAYVDGTKLSLTAAVTSAVAASPVTFQASTNTTFMYSEPIIVTVNGYHFGVSTNYSPDIYKYQSQGDGGNCAYIIEAGSFDPTSALAALEEYFHPSYTVTYKVKDGSDNILFTSDAVPTTLGANITTLPAEYQLTNFYEYNTVDVTISASGNTNVEFTATPKAEPLVKYTADTSNPYYYNLNIRSQYLVYNSEATGQVTLQSTSEPFNANASWAFIGEPYAGFKVINKAKGTDYFLTYTSVVTGNNSGNNNIQFVEAGEFNNRYWIVDKNTGGFVLRMKENTNIYFHHDNNKKFLRTCSVTEWSGVHNDAGSTIVASTDEDVLIALYNSMKDYTYGTAIGQCSAEGVTAADANATITQVGAAISSQMTSAYSVAYQALLQLQSVTTLNTPAAGFYRVKNVVTNKYLYATAASDYTSTDRYVYANGNNSGAETIIQLVEHEGHLYMLNQGHEFGWVAQPSTKSGQVGYVRDNVFDKYVNWLSGTAAGQIAFAICFGNGTGNYASYLTQGIYAVDTQDKAVIRGTEDYTANTAQWVFESATGFDVVMNGPVDDNYYATLCVPFDVTISDDATAYTLAKSESGNYLVPTEVENNEVPAGTPVLLKGTNSKATVTINTGSAFGSPLDCALTGTYLPKTITGTTDYVLGRNDGKVGFYHWNSNNLAANRAYLEATTTQARGFSLMFDDEATGIVAPTADTAGETNIYNLSGQRLNKVQKGINIVNGKKVLF